MTRPTVIYLAGNIRSGTRFLYRFFRNNTVGCICRHEPYPDLFGTPILAYVEGDTATIERAFLRKLRRINPHKHYCECNHAFLKSFADIAICYQPYLKLIHPIRDPLLVARSALNRKHAADFIPRFLTYYRGDDSRRYFRWTLTGNEPIYHSLRLLRLTPFQHYVVEWIEVENRCMRFLERYGKHKDCFTLHVPEDLGDEGRLREMLRFFGLQRKHERLDLRGGRNPNFVKTVPYPTDEGEIAEVVAHLPREYLRIFEGEPYVSQEWSVHLRRGAA